MANTPCTKRAYPTKSDAKRAIRSAENQGRKKDERPMYVYRCPHGCGWHLTSKRRRRKQLPPAPKFSHLTRK